MPNNRKTHTSLNQHIRRKLHQARLTGAPTWYKSPGRPKPPPEIPNAPPYFQKIRVLGSVTAEEPNLSISPFTIGDKYITLFTHLSVHRIDVWATTSDDTVAVSPYRQIGAEIIADRIFYGTGTANSIRPYVSVMLAQKDVITQQILNTASPIVDIKVFTSAGVAAESNCIVDLHCTFTSPSQQIELTLRVIRLKAKAKSKDAGEAESTPSSSFSNLSLE